METITLPPVKELSYQSILVDLFDLTVKTHSVKDCIKSIPELETEVNSTGRLEEIWDFFGNLHKQVKNYAQSQGPSRTIEMVLPLIGKYWIVSTDEKSEPTALVHPYELSRSVMSSLVVNLTQPNYSCSLATQHIGIFRDNNNDFWSGPLHFTEITEEDFHKRIADGIDNIFKYREYRKEQTTKK